MRRSLFILLISVHLIFAQDCPDALGGTLEDGGYRTVYPSATSCHCAEDSGEIDCNSGVLTGTTTFTHLTCSRGASCYCFGTPVGDIPWGGNSYVYSDSQSCYCGDVRGNIDCVEGALLGDTSYLYASCNNTCCFLNNDILQSGESTSYYEDSSPCGPCNLGDVHCNDGVATGTGTTFRYKTCVPVSCGGIIISHTYKT